MKIIQTAALTPASTPSVTEKLWVYNGLDCCVTAEVFEKLHTQLDNVTAATYGFEKDLQGPVLEINMRGIKVDFAARDQAIATYDKQLDLLNRLIDKLVCEGVGLDVFNWRSPQQLIKLFYNVMGYAPIKFKGKITVNRDALEKLEQHLYAGPIVRAILAARDVAKKISTLKTSIESDGRIRTSLSIAGTDSGRFSSAMSDFGSGGNLQNITEEIRRIFEADRGKKMAYIDLAQAESRAVGAITWNLFGDPKYLDACESGDLHTSVTKMTNPQLPWTGDLKKDKEIAETPFYRHFSYRHVCKVLGHGSSYGGKPWTMAKHTKLDQEVIRLFQDQFFSAFPSIPNWHKWVRNELLTEGHLFTLTGRRRWFFGRRSEDDTVRKAIAYSPQGSVADILNRGMLNVWRLHICELLLQIHDAILIQYPEELEDQIVPKVIETIITPIELNNGRILRIPADAKTGWNWASASATNPDGMKSYKPGDSRKRTSTGNLLDRLFI